MTESGSNWDPASQGVAAELLRTWGAIIPTLGEVSKILGIEEAPRFEVRAVQVWRVEQTPVGERTFAPVESCDLRPGTVLLLNMTLVFEGRQVTTMSTVYIDESEVPKVVNTDIPEFEFDQEDMADDELGDEILDKIRELLSGFPAFTMSFLAVLMKTKKRKPGAGDSA